MKSVFIYVGKFRSVAVDNPFSTRNLFLSCHLCIDPTGISDIIWCASWLSKLDMPIWEHPPKLSYLEGISDWVTLGRFAVFLAVY